VPAISPRTSVTRNAAAIGSTEPVNPQAKPGSLLNR
jgi:hypothetical protein